MRAQVAGESMGDGAPMRARGQALARWAVTLALGALLGGCGLAPREAGVVVVPTVDATARAEATATLTPQPTATPMPTSTLAPGSYKITGNVVIDGQARRIYARGDAGDGERTLVFDLEDTQPVDELAPAGMLAIDTEARRLYIDDITSGLTIVNLDDLSDRRFRKLPSLPRPMGLEKPDYPIERRCTPEAHIPFAGEVPPIPHAEGERIYLFRVLDILDLDLASDEAPASIRVPQPCSGFIAQAAHAPAEGLLYLTRLHYHVPLPDMMAAGARLQAVRTKDWRELSHDGLYLPHNLSIVDGQLLARAPEGRYGWMPVMRGWSGGVSEGRLERAFAVHRLLASTGAESGRAHHWGQLSSGVALARFAPDELSPSYLLPSPGGSLVAVDEERGLFAFSDGMLSTWTREELERRRPALLEPGVPGAYLRLLSSYREGDEDRFWLAGGREAWDPTQGRAVDRAGVGVPGCPSQSYSIGFLFDHGEGRFQSPSPALGCPPIHDLVEVPRREGTGTELLAATTGLGIWRLLQEDGVWEFAGTGIDTMEIDDLVVSPDYARDGRIFATGILHEAHSEVGAWGQGENSAWLSEDRGDTWRGLGGLAHIRPAPDFVTSGTLYAFGYANATVLRSDDRGESWREVGALPEPLNQGTELWALPSDDATLTVLLAYGHEVTDYGGAVGIEHPTWYRSEDEGASWEEISDPWPGDASFGRTWRDTTRVEMIGSLVAGDGTVSLLAIRDVGSQEYTRLRPRGLFASSDYGRSWDRLGSQTTHEADPRFLLGAAILGTDGDRVIVRSGQGSIDAVTLDAVVERLSQEVRRSYRPAARVPIEPR